ncbi:MAG TPA: cellulase family glycosylhydrolase [Ignavibacteriales bacterium]|nr:cellulase family glycosylhydrolase [Ignavibacteriales bacterium]
MKTLLKTFTLLALLTCILNAQTGRFVSIKGKIFLDPDGKPLFLKGINLGNWLVPEGYMFKFKNASSPMMIQEVISQMVGPEEAKKFWTKYQDSYITRKDIEFIKTSGLNSIRIPFDYRVLLESENPVRFSSRGFELLDRVISWCRELKVYVILDMHCAPGGQTGDNIDNSFGYPWLFESPESQELTAQIWQKIAEKYSSEEIIIGYDLLNEPIAHYFDTEKLNPLLEPLYKKITEAVRTADQNHLIFLGGAQWDSNFKPFGTPFEDKLVYNFHKYWTDTTQSVIQEYVDFSNKYNVPLWMSESGENKDEWIMSFRSLLEKNNISWAFWPYKKMEAQTCMVTFKRPEFYDLVIKFADKPRASYGELRKERPSSVEVLKALNGFLENCRFENCTVNDGYLKALGLRHAL